MFFCDAVKQWHQVNGILARQDRTGPVRGRYWLSGDLAALLHNGENGLIWGFRRTFEQWEESMEDKISRRANYARDRCGRLSQVGPKQKKQRTNEYILDHHSSCMEHQIQTSCKSLGCQLPTQIMLRSPLCRSGIRRSGGVL